MVTWCDTNGQTCTGKCMHLLASNESIWMSDGSYRGHLNSLPDGCCRKFYLQQWFPSGWFMWVSFVPISGIAHSDRSVTACHLLRSCHHHFAQLPEASRDGKLLLHLLILKMEVQYFWTWALCGPKVTEMGLQSASEGKAARAAT